MAKHKNVCKSCGRSDYQLVSFPCPNPGCSGSTIVRCRSCKENENSFTCGSCGFTGP